MIVNNCRIKYGSATQKNQFDDSRISIDFFVEDKKEEKALREAIDTVKSAITGKAKVQHIGCKKYEGKDKDDKDDGRWLFKTWTYAKQFESDLDTVIPMIKENGAEYSADERPNLSWGSIVNISLMPKEWSTSNGSDKGVKLILKKVQVVKAIEYDGGDEFGAVAGHRFTDHDFTELDEAIADEDKKLAKKLFKALEEDGADSKELKTRKKLLKAL